MISYQQAWDFLDNLQFFKIKLGLESMRLFLDRLESPHQHLRFIHIGGTNGKGSIAAMLVNILQHAGVKTGVYTSPHLSCVRERFKVDGRCISESDFARHAEKIINILDGSQITYFEFTTTLALLWFQEQGVDLVVFEVGLGGRLDATNVVTPLVSVITNVALDHELYLGTTITAIAGEKAGIIKNKMPVVCGKMDHDALGVMQRSAEEKQSPLYLLEDDFRMELTSLGRWTYHGFGPSFAKIDDLQTNLRGAHQRDNAAVALAALECILPQFDNIDETAVRRGLSEVVWPGRFELIEVSDEFQHSNDRLRAKMASGYSNKVILDGAHNPAGIMAFIQAVNDEMRYEKLILVWASMADKDIKGTLSLIAPLCSRIIFTRPERERSAHPDELKKLAEGTFSGPIACYEEVRDALCAALGSAEKNDLVCVAGSLYLIGKARRLLAGEICQNG